MKVGVLQVVLQLEGVRSLKEKRAVLRPILDNTKNRFNAAVVESGRHDSLRIAELGVVVASSESGHAESMLTTIAAFVESLGFSGTIASEHREVLSVSPVRSAREVQDVGNWSDFA